MMDLARVHLSKTVDNQTMHRSGPSAALDMVTFLGGHYVMVVIRRLNRHDARQGAFCNG